MTKKFSVSMPIEDWEWLRKQAKKEDLLLSQLIRKLIREYRKV